jgi:hypothetical protein
MTRATMPAGALRQTTEQAVPLVEMPKGGLRWLILATASGHEPETEVPAMPTTDCFGQLHTVAP